MKIILTTILLALTLFASNSTYRQVKILEKIISEISIDEKIKIWSDNNEILAQLKDNHKFYITDNCIDATIVILQDKNNLIKACNTKHIFVLNYQLLIDLPESFGAMFWKKGRPNIVILEPRIQAQDITVSKGLEPYLEEKIW